VLTMHPDVDRGALVAAKSTGPDPAYGRDSPNRTRTVRVDSVIRPGGIDFTETTQ
jgi:hypothetical protein